MSLIAEIMAQKEGIIDGIRSEEFKEYITSELNGTAGLEVAELEYNLLREKYSSLNANEFLRVFNILTEDNRCLIPKDYPLKSNKDFQMKWMYEKDLPISRNKIDNALEDAFF